MIGQSAAKLLRLIFLQLIDAEYGEGSETRW